MSCQLTSVFVETKDCISSSMSFIWCSCWVTEAATVLCNNSSCCVNWDWKFWISLLFLSSILSLRSKINKAQQWTVYVTEDDTQRRSTNGGSYIYKPILANKPETSEAEVSNSARISSARSTSTFSETSLFVCQKIANGCTNSRIIVALIGTCWCTEIK